MYADICNSVNDLYAEVFHIYFLCVYLVLWVALNYCDLENCLCINISFFKQIVIPTHAYYVGNCMVSSASPSIGWARGLAFKTVCMLLFQLNRRKDGLMKISTFVGVSIAFLHPCILIEILQEVKSVCFGSCIGYFFIVGCTWPPVTASN